LNSSSVHLPKRIISGGQTGVDRAALDWAISRNIEHGGWCPRGRIAEDGHIPSVYQLRELASSQYVDRTKQNIADSDATLVLYGRMLEGGTLLTFRQATRTGKPVFKVRLFGARPTLKLRDWLNEIAPKSLNIAGPRASNHPKIYDLAFDYLTEVFEGKLLI
jgi:predicted Rossmann fold nucleotide-binding protein DprA/Smf involved in DNA uptake